MSNNSLKDVRILDSYPRLVQYIDGIFYDGEGGIIETAFGQTLFQSDITVKLADNKTLGRFVNGDVIAAQGKSYEQVLRDIAIEYINPVFTSFIINGGAGNATTVEVGTTITSPQQFTWSTVANDGTISKIDIYNVTAGSYVVQNILNTGSYNATFTPILLTTPGVQQRWKGILYNTGIGAPFPTRDSMMFAITPYYKQFYGNTSSTVNSSSLARALPLNTFTTVNSLSLPLITTNKFAIAIPATKKVVTIITSSFETLYSSTNPGNYPLMVVTSMNVADASGTNVPYTVYNYSTATPLGVTATVTLSLI
jgi:hypothetical protein